jgi:hypothetical protein
VSLDENPEPAIETTPPTWADDGLSLIDGLLPAEVVWLVCVETVVVVVGVVEPV